MCLAHALSEMVAQPGFILGGMSGPPISAASCPDSHLPDKAFLVTPVLKGLPSTPFLPCTLPLTPPLHHLSGIRGPLDPNSASLVPSVAYGTI